MVSLQENKASLPDPEEDAFLARGKEDHFPIADRKFSLSSGERSFI
jgi:hypothetical protein